MILGIGVDSVEVHRFAAWHTYHERKLLRIFSEQEIKYCVQHYKKSAERFAVRFAAKEAFFKAFCAAFPDMYIPFLTMCCHVSVQKSAGRPVLNVDWHAIAPLHDALSLVCHISLTHSHQSATAFVILEKRN